MNYPIRVNKALNLILFNIYESEFIDNGGEMSHKDSLSFPQWLIAKELTTVEEAIDTQINYNEKANKHF